MVLPDRLFVQATHMEWIEEQEPPALIPVEDMEKANPIYKQDKAILQPWIDPHKLKKVEGTWYKDGRRVITNDLEHKRTLIQSHHDPPVYGHPGINRTIRLLERYCTTGGPSYKRTPQIMFKDVQSAKDTKSTHILQRHHSAPYIRSLKLSHSKP